MMKFTSQGGVNLMFLLIGKYVKFVVYHLRLMYLLRLVSGVVFYWMRGFVYFIHYF